MNEFLTSTNLTFLAVALALASLIVYKIRQATTKQDNQPEKQLYPKDKEPKLEQKPLQPLHPLPEQPQETGHPSWLKQVFSQKEATEKPEQFDFLLWAIQSGKVSGDLTTEIKNHKIGKQKFSGNLTINIGKNGHQPETSEEQITEKEIQELESQHGEDIEQLIRETTPKQNGKTKKTEREVIPEEPDWSLLPQIQKEELE